MNITLRGVESREDVIVALGYLMASLEPRQPCGAQGMLAQDGVEYDYTFKPAR